MLSNLDCLVAGIWILLLLVELVARSRQSCHDEVVEKETKEWHQLGSRASLDGADCGFLLPLPPRSLMASAGDLIRLPLAPFHLARQVTKAAGPAGSARRTGAHGSQSAARAAAERGANPSSGCGDSAAAKQQAAAGGNCARRKAGGRRNLTDTCQNRAPAPSTAKASQAAASSTEAPPPVAPRQPTVIKGVVPPPQLLAAGQAVAAASSPAAATPSPSGRNHYSGPRLCAPYVARAPAHRRKSLAVVVMRTPSSSSGGGLPDCSTTHGASACSPAPVPVPALGSGVEPAVPPGAAARVAKARPPPALYAASASPTGVAVATGDCRLTVSPRGGAGVSPPQAKPAAPAKPSPRQPRVQEPRVQELQAEAYPATAATHGEETSALPAHDDLEGEVWLPPPPTCGSPTSISSPNRLLAMLGHVSPRRRPAVPSATAAAAVSPERTTPAVAAALVILSPSKPAQSGEMSHRYLPPEGKALPDTQQPAAVRQPEVPPLLVRQLSICCAPVSTPPAPTPLSPAAAMRQSVGGGAWDGAEVVLALASCGSPRPSSSFVTPRDHHRPPSSNETLCWADSSLMSAAASAAAAARAAAASTARTPGRRGRVLRHVSVGAVGTATPVSSAHRADLADPTSATHPRHLMVNTSSRTPPRTPPVCSPAAPRGFNMLLATPFSPSVLTPPPALPPPPASPSRVLRPVPASAGGISGRARVLATPTAADAGRLESAEDVSSMPPPSPSVLARAAQFEQIAHAQAAAAAAAATSSPAPYAGAHHAANRTPRSAGQRSSGGGGSGASASRRLPQAAISESPVGGLQPALSAPPLWGSRSHSAVGVGAQPCFPADVPVDISFSLSCTGVAAGNGGAGSKSSGSDSSTGGASAECSITPSRASSFSLASSRAHAGSSGLCSSRTSWTGARTASGACSLGGGSSRSIGGSSGNSSGGAVPAGVTDLSGTIVVASS
ncbi:hypothetical protein HYH02_004070 [Chlamydomonas schloesseri]|uniref:Uncharacterized protein n=1 Tax=Chlamydomonas schloesseri TaxID=2026947 RepID=A0A835WQ81_9CHLO|nr:hypothetical protein HYH02_004070 [Chlamydomonas schloesseri]|eukprot:KAG2451472.1 hypothetical protein HYH02_004070 [Chlamydomonas schloesseri]